MTLHATFLALFLAVAPADAALRRAVDALLADLVGPGKATPEAIARYKVAVLAPVPAEGLDSDGTLDLLLCHYLVDMAPERLGEPHRLWPDTGPAGPIGRDRFDHLLRRWHRLDMDADGVLAIGRRAWAETIAELDRVALQIDPARTWREIAEDLKVDHPQADGIVAAYQEAVAEASSFVAARHLANLPEWGARIEVVPGKEEGVFPFARYESRGEDGGYAGALVATVPGADWPEARCDELLRAQHLAWIRVVALHEGVPGHHLQRGVESSTVTPLRRLAPSTVTVEGWGLYAERLMARAGYFEDPRQRLVQLKMSLWRAARAILDVELHTRRMPADEAVRFLVEEVGLERASAEAEVRRFLGTPTQPMSYCVGCAEIERLRAESEARDGAAFDLAGFHDRVLACGSVPISLVRTAVLGRTAAWR